MKKKIIRILSLLMALTLSFAIGCDFSDGGTGSTSAADSSSSSSSGGGETPPAGYEYGEDWADAYDEAYTNKLLAAGDEEFTKSQLSAKFDAGNVSPRSVKTGGKYVGMFYFMWLGQDWGNIYDISKLLEQSGNPSDTTNKLWALPKQANYDASASPLNAFHYFEEPLYGYYASWDQWVIRKHLQLLSFAGIDYLYLDFTNANMNGKNPVNLYPKATYALMDTILEMQAEGYNVPQIVPMVCNNTQSDQTIMNVVEWVYNNYYAYNDFKYKSCWFTADPVRNPSGKPLLAAYSFNKDLLSNKEIGDAFWVRYTRWPTLVTESSYKNGFPWMDYSLPQKNYDGIMNVSIAQHIDGNWSSEAYLARYKDNALYKYRGRGAYQNQTTAVETDSVENAAYNPNFISQWRNVLNYSGKDEVWMVNVTGWNEWVAQKLNLNNKYASFVDTFNVAFSRDIEMMRDGGYEDNAYLSLCQYVREFKYGKEDKKSQTAMWKRTTVDYKNISDWDKVSAKYIDFGGDAVNRNVKSAANKYTYVDNSARNDIDYVKIANDSKYLYVLVAAKSDITAHTAGDTDWMNLWISTGAKNSWKNYNYLINRMPENGVTSIEALGASKGKINAVRTNADADYYVEGKFISYRISLEALGITSASEIGIKVTDNIYANKDSDKNDGVGVFEFGDINAFYYGGDSAPMGRLNYAYRMGY